MAKANRKAKQNAVDDKNAYDLMMNLIRKKDIRYLDYDYVLDANRRDARKQINEDRKLHRAILNHVLTFRGYKNKMKGFVRRGHAKQLERRSKQIQRGYVIAKQWKDETNTQS